MLLEKVISKLMYQCNHLTTSFLLLSSGCFHGIRPWTPVQKKNNPETINQNFSSNETVPQVCNL